jgi:hypothetical protein
MNIKVLVIIYEDKSGILAAIKLNSQRMRTAKAQRKTESGKKVCDATLFKAFLKTLAENINVHGIVPKANR